jgi:hypothetical protein
MASICKALPSKSVAPAQDVYAELADVKRAMRKLGADHRQILLMICVQGMRYEEVSELLQVPVGTVRSRLSRARAQLQASMDTPSVRLHPHVKVGVWGETEQKVHVRAQLRQAGQDLVSVG